ncbi:MAG: flagellar protein export ATPase FliI [Acetobacteraceae bacterium]|nr:flagellar protein export ATPase FliI [Acetobacteraceae bacterium]
MRQNNLIEKIVLSSARLREIAPLTISGRIASVSGLVAEIAGLTGQVFVGDQVLLHGKDGMAVRAEIAGFRDGRAHAMPFGALDGLGPGQTATLLPRAAGSLAVSDRWLGRVIDPMGKAIDGRGPVPPGPTSRPIAASPPEATSRARLGDRITLGVRALDLFTTCRLGQRLGLFSGSGVGKSTLFAMLARAAICDVAVIALVGERGREVREFLEDDLGEDGLARAVVVVATSDAPPVLRRRAAYTAMTVAEHFRDHGKSVLFMMDSVTRFCLAAREIGLSAGEPPSTRGYPPSVFAELPRLLERAGPGEDKGDDTGFITALFTVLVEGDDTNEPVADAVRGILDGHVLLDRGIAEAGRYPPVDVLRSLSRAAQGCLTEEEMGLVRRARGILGLRAEMVDLVRMGAYRAGADPAVDEALVMGPRIEAVLSQDRAEQTAMDQAFVRLREAMSPEASIGA